MTIYIPEGVALKVGYAYKVEGSNFPRYCLEESKLYYLNSAHTKFGDSGNEVVISELGPIFNSKVLRYLDLEAFK